MPYETNWHPPGVFFKHGPFVVFYVYDKDDIELGRQSECFALCEEAEDNDAHGENGKFYLGELPESPHDLATEEGTKAHIIAAMEAGYFDGWDHDEPMADEPPAEEPAPAEAPQLASYERGGTVGLGSLTVRNFGPEDDAGAVLFGFTEILGTMHHVRLVNVNDDGQPTDDPQGHFDDIQNMNPGRLLSVDLSIFGYPDGAWVLAIFPFAD